MNPVYAREAGGLQHSSVPPAERRTSAAMRFRGNWRLTTNGLAATVPVDIGDLSSHDVCAFAAGPATVADMASRREMARIVDGAEMAESRPACASLRRQWSAHSP